MKGLYQKLLPYEWRYWLYKLRNPGEFSQLRKVVNPSPKGDFSLRSFDQNKCIFVHITKTAGTSVALSLFGELPYHYTAQQYRVIYGRKSFNDYYKFAFVRNPWDRLYSAFSYLKAGGWNEQDKKWAAQNLADIADFNTFVLQWFSPEKLYSHIHFWPQSDFICDRQGRPIIDDLYFFESIKHDYDIIREKISTGSELGHKNAVSKKSYSDIYTPEAIEKVRAIYHQDIKNFSYDFTNRADVEIKDRRFVTNG